MKLNLNSNANSFFSRVSQHHKKFEEIVRKSVNDAARESAKAVEASMDREMDRPTPFTKRGVAVRFASRMGASRATVLIKDRQAEYLQFQAFGGSRAPAPGRKVNPVPTDEAERNEYGNLPRRERKKLYRKANQKSKKKYGKRRKGKKTYFIASSNPKTKHLPKGLYYRDQHGYIQIVIGHERNTRYKRRWKPGPIFHKKAIAVFERSMKRRLKAEGMT